MRLMELKIEPAKFQITQEEILADLRYPDPGKRGPAQEGAKRR